MQLPEELDQSVTDALSKAMNTKVALINFSPASGGCINNGGKLETTAGVFFLKWNDANRFPGMLKTEARGLKVLQAANALHVPEVISEGSTDKIQFLLLTYTASSSKSGSYWRELGEGLARLHRVSHSFFGLDHDNYIGSLAQSNTQSDAWVNFFIHERLRKQLSLAARRGLADAMVIRKFDLLFKRLPALLPAESPSLLHGDLWGGNIMVTESGGPSVIDPAVYFGHRETDIAMTTLFGGFQPEFYRSYEEAYPMESGYRDRLEIYNLYPLLVHVNLFGASYLSQVRQVLDRFA